MHIYKISIIVFLFLMAAVTSNQYCWSEENPSAQSQLNDQNKPLQSSVSLWSNEASMLNSSIDANITRPPFILRGSKKDLLPLCAQWLNHYHPAFAQKINSLDPKAVIEVGNFCDNTGHVLKAFAIPFIKTNPQHLQRDIDTQTKVLVIDCCWYLGIHRIEKDTDLIRNFVSKGGYVITTGWGARAIEDIFPGFVSVQKKVLADGKGMGNMDIECVPPEAKIFTGCPFSSRMMTCEGSRPIKIISPDCRPLLFSQSLAGKVKKNAVYAAVGFKYGKGAVLIFTGHLDFNELAGEKLPVRRGSLLAMTVDILGPREVGASQLMMINFITKALDKSI